MPSSASTVNQTLTNYARGFVQDRQAGIADFLAPRVEVGAATGRFKSFNDKNAFQVLATDRAIGGPARRIEFAASDPTYNCKPQALELVIDDHERAEAGEGDPLGLEQAKVETLISTAVLSHEDKVLTAIKDGVSAVAAKGIWSDKDVDPVEEIDEQIEAIAVATGRMPNRLALGIGALRVLRAHPKVLARQPGAALVGLTVQQLAAMLLNPAIDIRVGVLSKDAAKFGAAKNATNIVGAEVFVFLGEDSPTLYDPSFAKTFVTRGGGVDAVHMYRDDRNRGDVIAVDWSEDIQVVSTACVRRLSIS